MTMQTDSQIQLNNDELVHMYIDISYSKSRKKEMKHADKKNCPLLVSLLRGTLEKNNALDIITTIPKNSNRSADIVLEFTISKENLDHVLDLLKQVGGSNVGSFEPYVLA